MPSWQPERARWVGRPNSSECLAELYEIGCSGVDLLLLVAGTHRHIPPQGDDQRQPALIQMGHA